MRLQLIKAQMIRSEVIVVYTFVDELLTTIICNYYFRVPRRKRAAKHHQLWKTKHFRIFNHQIMDEIYLFKKLSIVRAMREIPKNVVSAVGRINDLRNVLAHAFFPENRRQYMSQKKVIYRGNDIFTVAGVLGFEEDRKLVLDYFWKRAFG